MGRRDTERSTQGGHRSTRPLHPPSRKTPQAEPHRDRKGNTGFLPWDKPLKSPRGALGGGVCVSKPHLPEKGDMSKQTDPPGPGGLALPARMDVLSWGQGPSLGSSSHGQRLAAPQGPAFTPNDLPDVTKPGEQGLFVLQHRPLDCKKDRQGPWAPGAMPTAANSYPKTSGHPGGRSGDITAGYHSPCLLPMSTSTSWKLSGPSACGGRSLRHQAWTPNSPRTPTRPAEPTAAYTPDVRAAGEPPAPRSGQCSVGSHVWTRRPHPPCREQSQELGSHGPHPSQLPPADPGPWAWVSLEPGRVDLQDFLGVGHSADDPGLRCGLSGPRASAALLLCTPTGPGLAPCPGVRSEHRWGECLQLEVSRVLCDVVSPKRQLLKGGGRMWTGAGAVLDATKAPPGTGPASAPAGALLPAPPRSWPGGGQ